MKLSLRLTFGLVVTLLPCVGQSFTAYEVPAGQEGNQGFGGGLGMDFIVNQVITVSELGVFDDLSDGLKTNLSVALWRRDDGGTPDDPADDVGLEILAAETFAPGNDGTLEGGNRFKILARAVALEPGAYSIVASGYAADERNGNAGNPNIGWTSNDGNGALRFVGGGRWGNDPNLFPENADGGPENRYAAGTFKFSVGGGALIAYQIEEGTEGTQDFGGSLGMDFVLNDPIQVTELGAFDSLSDGLNLAITVQLWSRDDAGTPSDFADDVAGEVLASLMFTPEDSGVLDGGSRFKPLETPLTLLPGSYAIVAWGYGPEERNGNGFGNGGFGAVVEVPAISFVGNSHWGDPEAYPVNTDSGPENRYGGGTFKFLVNLDDSDGDGWDDRFETRLFGDLSQSPASDADGDGVANGKEIDQKSDPLSADTDGDGLADGAETGTGVFVSNENAGTNPLRTDSDADGLSDGSEITDYGTNPTIADTDTDGVADGAEIAQGFDPLNPNSRPALRDLALAIESGTLGNQAYGEGLGMDFVVNNPIELFELGAFDDGSNGLNLPITVSVWSRDDGGTPEEPADDSAGAKIADLAFTPDDFGFPSGGSVFKPLSAPLVLAPGAYTIVASGYGAGERNGNSGGNGSFGTLTDSAAITFVGLSRYGGGLEEWPPNLDSGPANRYGAGTFTFRRVQTDSDGDGIEDAIEVALGSDPQNSASLPPADAVFLTSSNVPWDLPAAWSDGLAPSAGKHYYVIGGVANRLLAPAGEAVFQGDSLTVLGDAAVLELGAESTVATIGDLRLRQGGSIAHTAAGQTRTLGGGLTVEEPSLIQLGNGDRTLNLSAALRGAGTLTLRQVAGQPEGVVELTHADNAFAGTWGIENVTLHARALNSLGTGDITIDGNGHLDADYNINNPVGILTLLSEESLVVLDQAHVFATFVLGTIDIGAAVGAGTYTQADLITNVDPALEANFTNGGGSITIGGDSDGDRLLDDWEIAHFGGLGESGDGDKDGDGLTNAEEFGLGADPNKADSDGDGLSDGEEKAMGTNLAKADTDGDGLTDAEETSTDPTRADTDADGLTDSQEIRDTLTDPNKADSDGDGALDGVEVAKGTDPLDAASVAPAVAYVVPAGTSGNQAFGGSLGMDFDVLRPIEVRELGVFDSDGDGLSLDITVAIWSRDDAGTPGNPDDDQAGAMLQTLTFTVGDPGVLQDGSRFKPLPQSLLLQPGNYTIVASGYGDLEPNGNQGSTDLGLSVDSSGAIAFVGNGHWGDDPGSYPPNQDGGPMNRYAAGTFSFVQAGTAPPEGAVNFQILSIVRSGGDLSLTWTALDQATYRVEASADLQRWEPVVTGLTNAQYTGTDALDGVRFFRVVEE